MAVRWPFYRRPSGPPTARVGAVQQMTSDTARAQKRLRQKWQTRADFFGRNLGVIRFACGLKADSCARSDLVPEKLVDARSDTWEPVDPDQPDGQKLYELLHAYRGQAQNQRELVRLHSWLYETVGEMVSTVETVNGRAVFGIRSPLACEWRSHDLLVRDIEGGSQRDGTARIVPFERARRLWIPDETWPALAASPVQGVIADCERYWSLARRIRREAESALLMNKAIWIPTEANQGLPREVTGPGGPGVPMTKLEQQFYETAMRTIEDEDNLRVESLAPFIMQWSKDHGPPVEVELGKPLDPNGIPYRTESLEAIARGLDYPQRLLVSGPGDTNHWSSWLLEEQFTKQGVAPMLERICWTDLTEAFYRPALRTLIARGQFSGRAEHYRVGFDMGPIIVKPDQTRVALELYQLGVLGDMTLLDKAGFDPTDIPDRAELGRWIVRTQTLSKAKQDWGGGGIPADGGSTERGIPDTMPAIAAASAVRETVSVGPFPGEEIGWLD